MRNYHKDASCPRLALKVDLMKAFDMVDWGFLLETLTAFHFLFKVIMWIKACLTTPKFSISFNGELVGFFFGKRSLRQGDPMSPYLFVIAMEVLSKILAKRIEDSSSFKFHWRCVKIKLSHPCFADDLIMLCHGSLSSARVVKAALDEFSLLSGLHANHAKSNIFTSGVSPTINQQLINLFDRVSGRLASWLNRGLSYTGRLQLIVSVLTCLQVFWASYLCLPKNVFNIIEQKFRTFLWKGIEGDSKGANICWYDVCLPKKEGGLGINDISSWNKALMIRHIWILSYSTNNLWSSWIKAYHLKDSNLWEAKAPCTCSWNCRKLLHLQPFVHPLIQHFIGNGSSTSLWFDNWHPDGPLLSKWSSHVVYDSCLSIYATVSSIVHGDSWSWPTAMSIDLFEIRSRMPSYNPNSNVDDRVCWLSSSNGTYSASSALASLRTPHLIVPWFKLVWFP
ncbi:hypothetical protein Dsin_012469 [Dipteronia sinensis]|uniref:Reverse transcriptase domain-containing protein n=1 Tax=Dipteronia sinensis TaxID=43782 RepID=A0AAE0E872_9ROSI|nr:hypothetical protein Dsin_012469 [Dipteronia sinensis]